MFTYRLIFKLLRDALIPGEALGLRGKECLQEYLKCSLEILKYLHIKSPKLEHL